MKPTKVVSFSHRNYLTSSWMRTSWRTPASTSLITWRPTGRRHTPQAATLPTLCSTVLWPRQPWPPPLSPSPTYRYRCSLPCAEIWICGKTWTVLLPGSGKWKNMLCKVELRGGGTPATQPQAILSGLLSLP